MQSIETKRHGATNTKGERISATSTGGTRIYVSWDYGLGIEENHDAAAERLTRALKWNPVTYVRGSAPKGRGNLYIIDAPRERLTVE